MHTARSAGTAVILSLLVLLGGFGAVAEASAEGTDQSDFPNISVTEERITGVLGGGTFVGIHNKDNDAMIGVLYGTKDDPNNVYVVSIFTRYLGVADIYGRNGKEMASGNPIPVRTLYAQRFDTLYEFDDRDGDGIWDSRRMAESRANDTDPITKDPVFKMVPLRTAWTSSGVTKRDNGNGSVEWELTLSAYNLSYVHPILGIGVDRQNRLEEVSLTFHLYVEKRNVTRTDIPVYRIEVSKRMTGWGIDDVQPKGNRTVSGCAVRADVKYDHYIEGWDFSMRNANRSLLLSTEVLFLNAISQRASEWLKDRRAGGMTGGNGTAAFQTPEGAFSVDERDASAITGDPVLSKDVQRPRIVRKNALGLIDNWRKVGGLGWTSNVTVDGQEEKMFFQVYMGRAVAGVNANGAVYAGFGVVAGFSYPGGSRIYHDPVFQVESFAPSLDDGNGPRVLLFAVLMMAGAAVVAVVVVVAVGGLAALRRKEALPSGKDEDEDYYATYYIDKGRR